MAPVPKMLPEKKRMVQFRKKGPHDVPLNWLIKGGPISPCIYIYISPDHERNHHPANDLMLFNYIILRAFQERHVPNFRDVNPSGQVHKGFPWIPRRYRLRRQEGKQGLHIGVELRAVEMA